MKKNYKRFKINILRGLKDYYDVYVFHNRASMRLFSRQMFDNGTIKFEAVTHSFKTYKTIGGKEIQTDKVGAIMLYKGGFGNGIVSHELAHAVNHYFVQNKMKFDLGGKINNDWKEKNEIYATILGYMVNQFWKKWGHTPGKEKY